MPILSVSDLIQNIRTLSVADLRVRLERLFLNDRTGYRVVSELYKPKRKKPQCPSPASVTQSSSVLTSSSGSFSSAQSTHLTTSPAAKCTLPTPEATHASLPGPTPETPVPLRTERSSGMYGSGTMGKSDVLRSPNKKVYTTPDGKSYLL